MAIGGRRRPAGKGDLIQAGRDGVALLAGEHEPQVALGSAVVGQAPFVQFASGQMAKMNGRQTPVPLNTAVTAQMKRMPRSSTGPEILIRRELHRRGLRFRVNHPRLPGRPDIAFTAARLAVFVDGCFWHSCPDHRVFPKNNHDWWREKLERNVARDREKDSQLDLMGWIVVHVWEHQDPIEAADAIERLWRSRRQLAARRAGPRSRERDV